MAQTKVSVRTLHDAPTAVGWSGHRTLTIDRPEDAGGLGLGYSGGELLLLALPAVPRSEPVSMDGWGGIDREALLGDPRPPDTRELGVGVHRPPQRWHRPVTIGERAEVVCQVLVTLDLADG